MAKRWLAEWTAKDPRTGSDGAKYFKSKAEAETFMKEHADRYGAVGFVTEE